MIPPKQEGNIRYMEGLSDVCFKKGKYLSLSTGELYNQDHAWRYFHTIIAAVHEIGHALGALHDDSYPNIMHSNVLPYVDSYPLSFSDKSKQEINQCLDSTKKIL